MPAGRIDARSLLADRLADRRQAQGRENPAMISRRILAGLAALAGAGALMLVPAAAAAAPSHPSAVRSAASAPKYVSSIKCGGDVCIQDFTSPDDPPGFRTFLIGANGSTFRGHFRLAGPTFVGNSPTRTWRPHGIGGSGGYWGVVIRVKTGWYCARAYKTSGKSIGRKCQHV
jgi:hypothetical protein